MAFRADNGPDTVRCDARTIHLPKIGAVRTREACRFPGPVRECTVKHDGIRWQAAVVGEIEDPERPLRRVAYARVSSADQQPDLGRQKLRLLECGQHQGWLFDAVVTEVGSGLNGTRRKLLKALGDSQLGWIVVEHRDRLARFGFELVDSLLRARGGGVVVIEDREVDDDLVRDMTEVLTSMCARLYGRRSAKARACRALKAAAAS